MRVVHVITALGQGGAEAMLEKLVLASARLDPDVVHEVISLGTLGSVGERLRARGVTVIPLRIRGLATLIRGVASLWLHIRRARPDVTVQTWLYHGDVVGGLVARAAGVKRVFWNVRQTLRSPKDLRPLTRVMLRLSAKLSGVVPARVICCAESARLSHVAVGYRAAKCVVVDNGFDTESMRRSDAGRSRLRKELEVPPAAALVGIVGRLDPAKDHETFLNAARIVSSDCSDARFLLVGRGVDTDEKLRGRIVANGLASRTTTLEQQTDMASVMSALDVLVISSRWEGFPNVLGEAMACEVPCVTTDVGDARRILGDDRFVVSVGDAIGLARAIESLCRASESDRRQLGAVLRERIVREFAIDGSWARYLSLYRCGL